MHDYATFGKLTFKTMQRIRQHSVSLIIMLLMIGVVVFSAYRYQYPRGVRPAFLPVLLAALRAYSNNNGGAFPNAGNQPLESLKQLYPKYLPDCEPLAGLSGDMKLLKKEILDNSPITEAASSWVYWPGLRADDNPDIALVWERKQGLRFNGSRAVGHEVGFVGGYMRQIKNSEWETFLKDQEKLRQRAVTHRDAQQQSP